MATIKAIEAKSVHQIQSGQVIADLCSVVKELLENSLDAGATVLEVRFKNYGLDAVEVQDNGSGINPENYASVALKHFTSKLSNFEDLSKINTFGFRGEALSSLCALSNFYMTTAQEHEAPKGTRLDFDVMGRLKGQSTVACQRGSTAYVEELFSTLPVRRKELTKNIKREYGKVIGLLHAYACIGVGIKFTVKHTPLKGKSMVVFSTRGNKSTRDNIANVYGAKTLPALVSLNLNLRKDPIAEDGVDVDGDKQVGDSPTLSVTGHISKPVFGEGRQTPDRQLFFVNGRPCGLPQIAKAINEVYKSFNVSQSPFIFANFIMDTSAYDVNVSPDKRTILLHDSAHLIERLKKTLTELFDNHEQSVPQSQLQTLKLPAFRQPTMYRSATSTPEGEKAVTKTPNAPSTVSKLIDDFVALTDRDASPAPPKSAFAEHFRNQASTREAEHEVGEQRRRSRPRIESPMVFKKPADQNGGNANDNGEVSTNGFGSSPPNSPDIPEIDSAAENAVRAVGDAASIQVRDFNARMEEAQKAKPRTAADGTAGQIVPRDPDAISPEAGVVLNAFDRMRPRRADAQLATITVDGQTTTTVIGTHIASNKQRLKPGLQHKGGIPVLDTAQPLSQFSQRLQRFGASNTAPQSQPDADDSGDERSEEDSQVETTDDSDENEHRSANSEPSRESHNPSSGSDTDDDAATGAGLLDDATEKLDEDARVAALIQAAEKSSAKVDAQRAMKALKGMLSKDSTTELMTTMECDLDEMKSQALSARQRGESVLVRAPSQDVDLLAKDDESRLSLTVSKGDFARMEIVGQFNLGFILAVRRASNTNKAHGKDELFIIDQHASDEKFNFERLQAETTVSSQRMVRPVNLDLTAVEEEVVLENPLGFEKNGFTMEVDTSGDQPVGRRCTLLSLPLSKEVVFDTRDLDELIHLLSESPMLGKESAVPRPSRVRKMFAMRACRSSIMIGKTLSKQQMRTVVTHMGTIDKPWNCPHGRPTMRHLSSLNGLELWQEGEGVCLEQSSIGMRHAATARVWRDFLEQQG
jgi:DNA mismatch repair protein PMS2